MKEITLLSDSGNLSDILLFIESYLEQYNISIKSKFQLELAIEEIFVNIVSYAYQSEKGKITIKCDVIEDPLEITIQFIDKGPQFNPLSVEHPDTDEDVEDREIGGLGIFLVKKNVDDIFYEFKDNSNILTIKKLLV